MDGLTKKACKANGALRLDPTSLTQDTQYPDASCPGEGPLGFDVSCPTRPVACTLGTGLVTIVTSNQSLGPEPGTVVKDTFEYIL